MAINGLSIFFSLQGSFPEANSTNVHPKLHISEAKHGLLKKH